MLEHGYSIAPEHNGLISSVFIKEVKDQILKNKKIIKTFINSRKNI